MTQRDDKTETLPEDDHVQVYATAHYYAALGPADKIIGGGGMYSARSYWSQQKVDAAELLYEDWLSEIRRLVASGLSVPAARRELGEHYPRFKLSNDERDAIDPGVVARRSGNRARYLESVARERAEQERAQAEKIAALDMAPEALIEKAIECLHALNRHAKHRPVMVHEIYEIKTKFLDALTRAGLARVESYQWLHWLGDNAERKTWYIVECGAYRFHQPSSSVTPAIESAAQPIAKPHDPKQPAREIPETGLSTADQFFYIEAAIVGIEGRLAREGTAS